MQDKWKTWLSVACFAFLGGALRAWLNNSWSQWGTLTANLAGCFLLAFLIYVFISLSASSQWLSTGLSTGFVGAFTTFSSFNLDTLKMLQAGKGQTALIYWLASVFLGFLAAYAGMRTALAFTKKREGA